jgi:putative glutamine amidotransferase
MDRPRDVAHPPVHTVNAHPSPRPVIGISSGRGDVVVAEGTLASHYVGRGYVRAVAAAGGIPVVLPSVESPDGLVDALLDLLDGLVLAGGNDISPQLSGCAAGEVVKPDPVRDAFELALLAGARMRMLPVLGVCRGMELINVGYGGTIMSGVRHEIGSAVHLPELGAAHLHQVRLAAGTRAAQLFAAAQVEAVCVHHQAPDRIGSGLVVSGTSADGIAEVIEDTERWVIGVIWHPEQALDRAASHQRIYSALVEEASRRG